MECRIETEDGMNRLILAARLLICAVLVCAAGFTAYAQNFPDRPLHLIVPYGPGGITDFAGRTLGARLGDILGQPVVVENKPGASGTVGVNYVAHSAPDGYSMAIMDPAIVINQILQKSMPYDIFKDIVTLSIISSSPTVLVVTPELGIKTYAELVAFGKANPGKLNFATAGIGTAPHLAAELWMLRTGINAVHVSYKGIGASYTDLMSGKIQMAFSSIAGALPFTSDGRIIALATTGTERSPVYPDLPTVAEGGLPGYNVDLWLGLYGTAGTPPDVLTKLNGAIGKALQDSDLKASFAKFGLTPRGTSMADGAAFVNDEYAKWQKVITDAHITVD
jgi:tripartite-type tricarboxylate transporter receptor subunit TctC